VQAITYGLLFFKQIWPLY